MYEEEKDSKTGLLIGLGVLFVAALAAIFFVKARKPEAVPAPRAFTPYASADKSFTCAAPGGWDKQDGAAHGIMSTAVFGRGPAKISVTSDLQGSLMADASPSFGGPGGGEISAADVPPSMEGMVAGANAAMKEARKPPVEKLHEMGKGTLARDFKEYEETAGQPMPSPVGDARFSEFTADGGWRVGKVRGYRVTMLGGERRITVVCQCPEENWATLKPAFGRVIASVAPGSGG